MADTGLIAFLALIAAPATNSGLIVFLPLVGAILGGIVGAVGGAWANSKARDREAKKAEHQELMGLMSLINSEVTVNDSLLTSYRSSPAEIVAQLESSVWDKTQIRLAQLLPEQEIQDFVLYYAQLRMLQTQLNWSPDDQDPIVKTIVKTMANNIVDVGDGVKNIARKYMDDPDFVEADDFMDNPNFIQEVLDLQQEDEDVE